mgnify:CR=1 FL=1
MSDVKYYRGVFITMSEGYETAEEVYYCTQCVTIGGELDIEANTVYNADAILGLFNGNIILISKDMKLTMGKGEITELVNGESSKVYGEINL